MSNNNKTILIVDDSFNNLLLLEDLLSEMTYNVIVARNGVEALFKLNEISIDLVLLDIMMPRMDGFELMKNMTNNGFDNIPVIFITAKNNEEDKNRAFEMGAVDYIIKPVVINQILAKVESALTEKTQLK